MLKINNLIYQYKLIHKFFNVHLKIPILFCFQLSWVDFLFVGFIEVSILIFGINIKDKYPYATELQKKITSLPGVKEYIASRQPYSL